MIFIRLGKSMVVCLFAFILVACSALNPNQTTPTPQINIGYPYPGSGESNQPYVPPPSGSGTTSDSSSSYPGPGSVIIPQPNALPTSPYPQPEQTTQLPGVRVAVVPFKLEKPIVEGTTEVRGTGPADIPILLMDISLMGDTLADTTIQPDGTFVFTLPDPLQKDHLIGITLADLSGTIWTTNNFDNPGFEGDTPSLIPQVGYFFDTALVEPK